MFSTIFSVLFAFWYGLHIAYSSPFFLAAPPTCLLWKRLQALAGTLKSSSSEVPDYKMPKESRNYYIFKTILFYGTMLIIDILFLIDDVFYGDYQKCSLDDAVFIVGGFRTGTTNLHRAIHLDEERFVSPRFHEIIMPYLWMGKIFDWLEKRDPKIIKNIEAKLQDGFGKDNLARHPMSWHGAEEDDLLLASWNFAGWYVCVLFAHPEAIIHSGLQDQLPESAQKKMFEFYKRSLQKVLYRRGNGRTLLSKHHMVNFLPMLSRELPNAKFVDIARHPKDSFCSLYALSQSAQAIFSRAPLPKEIAVPFGLCLYDHFTKAETDFFIEDKSCGNAKDNRILITFNEYVKDQESVVRKLYKQWGYELEGSEYEKRLVADNEKHRNYKKNSGYTNPTLKELGLTEEMMNERYCDYVSKCSL